LDSLAIGQRETIRQTNSETVTVRRNAWGLFEVTATVQTGLARVREAMILRTVDFARGMEEANEAVVTAGVLTARHARFSRDATLCTVPYLPSRSSSLITVSHARYAFGLVDVNVDSLHAVPPPGYAFAGIRWEEVASIADRIIYGSIDFAVIDSVSVPPMKLTYASADLVLHGGEGSGLLLVNGNLDIGAGVVFNGIIVVRGTVNVEDGVRINGALRAQGSGSSFIGAADIVFSRCQCGRVLLETPAATRPIRAQRQFIPTF
jgi:hypothetical protein